MKQLDRKFLVTCSIVILIPIFIIILLFSIRGCSGKMKSEDYEELMVRKAKMYANRHKLNPSRGKSTILKIDELKDAGLKSPEKALKDTTCNGSVIIKNNGNDIIDKDLYLYTPYLECSTYKTDYIKDHLMKDVVSEGSGLYKSGKEYIYKGNKVNNYVLFFGKIYRIIKIDENGNMKLIKEEAENVSTSWDFKYNIDEKGYTGVNNYYDSKIIDRLKDGYLKARDMNDNARSYIVPTSICVGKRSSEDKNVSVTTECNDTLKDQLITLPSVTDYTMSSYDPNCTSLDSPSCTNYNYFAEFIGETWTLNATSDNTANVYYIDSSRIELEEARDYKPFNWVIYVNSEILYKSGDGSLSKPYIIK